MKTRLIAILIIIAATPVMRSAAQTPLGTDFTYQGQLKGAGEISTADFQFSLFDAVDTGNQVGTTQNRPNVGIVNGLFTISLDFGSSAFQGDARWIEVAVRSPAGSGGFTTLSPRQPLTAAPYALQTRGITVDASDRVGIGTQSPAKKLTVAGDMELGTSSGDYRHMRIGGGNSDGFLYGSFAALGDGIHMGYNYLADAAGAHQVIHSDGATSRISMRYGSIALATGGINTPPMDRLTVDQGGNVNVPSRIGIGTSTFPAKLAILTDFATGALIEHDDPDGTGLFALISGDSGVNQAIRGQSLSPDGWGVFSAGRFGASGTKSFQIDHPLDPENKYLFHYCTEGPEPQNVYNGSVRLDAVGEAWIDLPDYFETINRDPRIQLTPAGVAMPNLHASEEITGNRFRMAGGAPGGKVYWEVKAIRNDRWVQKYGARVEIEKPKHERGKYQHPELYGQPKEKGTHYHLQLKR